MPMIAMTTNNSTSVNAPRRGTADELRTFRAQKYFVDI
jgi:hypothetical protein